MKVLFNIILGFRVDFLFFLDFKYLGIINRVLIEINPVFKEIYQIPVHLAIFIPIYFSYAYLLLKTSCKTLFPDKVFIQKTLAEKQLR